MQVFNIRSNMGSNYGTNVFYCAPLQMRKLKLMQIDSTPDASCTFPAETRSNNSGRYTLLSLIYLDLTILVILLQNGHINPVLPWKRCSSVVFSQCFEYEGLENRVFLSHSKSIICYKIH